jgi:hypothetical protein
MKNVIVLNNRNLNFYDFKELKDKHDLRISAVVFDSTCKSLSDNAKKYLDEIYVLPDLIIHQEIFPPFPKKTLIPIIENNLSKFKNVWLIASDELNILNASSLREQYRLPGMKYSIGLNYRNKVIQKMKLSDGGLKTPKFMELQENNIKNGKTIIYEEIIVNLNTPFIIKPTEMFGTIGVEKITSYNQFCNYFAKFSNFSEFIAEELINDQLYHCDFIIQNNQYVFAEVSEYLRNGLSFINGYNHGSFLLNHNHPLRLPIIDFCKKANKILGLKSGCAHFEVFVTKNQEIIFLEAAGRPAGSIVPLVFTKTFRKNYMNAALLAEIEEDPGIFKDPSEYCFWTFFPKKSGIVESFNPIPIKSFYDVEWFVQVGDIMVNSSSIAEKSGLLIANNKNYQILKCDFHTIKNFNAIKLKNI